MYRAIRGRDRREQLILELIGDDVSHVRQISQFTWTSRRVAPGDHDSNIGVAASNSPDGLPCALIGRRGDGAGIHDDEIGFIG
jgi:hypothetical protein